jgi:hypothetical protein
LVTEFDRNGNIIAEGEYFEGLEEGKWIYNLENHRIEGTIFCRSETVCGSIFIPTDNSALRASLSTTIPTENTFITGKTVKRKMKKITSWAERKAIGYAIMRMALPYS